MAHTHQAPARTSANFVKLELLGTNLPPLQPCSLLSPWSREEGRRLFWPSDLGLDEFLKVRPSPGLDFSPWPPTTPDIPTHSSRGGAGGSSSGAGPGPGRSPCSVPGLGCPRACSCYVGIRTASPEPTPLPLSGLFPPASASPGLGPPPTEAVSLSLAISLSLCLSCLFQYADTDCAL